MNITNNPAPSLPPAGHPDAISLLKADYERLMELFADYHRARAPAKRRGVVRVICTELSVHAQIKEEIFYPEVAAALQGKWPSDAQDGFEALIAPLEELATKGDMCDLRIGALANYLHRCVREEQQRIFPKVRESLLDLFEIGARMAARRADLLAEAGGSSAARPNAKPRFEMRAS